MSRYIFVNLPVKDVQRSRQFFTALGFSFHPDYTTERSACMVISDNSFVMMLTEDYFQTFIKKPVADATQSIEVLIAVSCGSRQEVDDSVTKAVASGGIEFREAQDHGFMYARSFEDLDGHVWEFAFMDPDARG